MKSLFQLLSRVFLFSLVAIFIAVSTFITEALAEETCNDTDADYCVTVGYEQRLVYFPENRCINRGDTVQWEWQTSGHSVTFDNEEILEDSGVRSSGSKYPNEPHQFDDEGEFSYHCSVHSLMTGTVTVSDQCDDTNPKTLKNRCSIDSNQGNRPDFKKPLFADADKGPITLIAREAEFSLDGDKNDSKKYKGYLYAPIYYNPDGHRVTLDENGEEVNYEEGTTTPYGTYNPPVILVPHSNPTDGDKFFNLNLINDLPVKVQLEGGLPQTKENLESVSQYSNIHYHGFNVSPLLGADDVLVSVPSNVTPKPIAVGNRKFIPVPPLGETTPDSLHPDVTTDNLPGGYYPEDNPNQPKYNPITDYKMGFLIPDIHQSGLFWYHSHAHSLSNQQVLAGLSGGIIIRGSENFYGQFLEPENEENYPQFERSRISGKFAANSLEPKIKQKVMMFKDFTNVLDSEDQQNCLTLNNQVNPKITIEPGEIQLWRIANIGANSYMNIALENFDPHTGGSDEYKNAEFTKPYGNSNFYILARDGDVVEQPVATDSVLLPPGARVELLVVGDEPGSKYYLVSDLSTELMDNEKPWVSQGNSHILASVEVTNSEMPKTYIYNPYFWYRKEVSVCQEDTDANTRRCENGNINLDYFIRNQKPYKIDDILPNPGIVYKLTETAPKNDSDLIGLGFGALQIYELKHNYGCDPSQDVDQCTQIQDFLKILRIVPSDEYNSENQYENELNGKRFFYFSQGDEKFFLKGFAEAQQLDDLNTIKEVYDGNRIDKISRVGDIEEWELVNADDEAHVFHIHQLDFVPTEVTLSQDPGETYNNYEIEGTCEDGQTLPGSDDNGFKCKLKPQGYRDVINLPPHSVTKIRIPFVNPFITGVFVYHCHILAHEDKGMMHNLKVINPEGYTEQDLVEVKRFFDILDKN